MDLNIVKQKMFIINSVYKLSKIHSILAIHSYWI